MRDYAYDIFGLMLAEPRHNYDCRHNRSFINTPKHTQEPPRRRRLDMLEERGSFASLFIIMPRKFYRAASGFRDAHAQSRVDGRASR